MKGIARVVIMAVVVLSALSVLHCDDQEDPNFINSNYMVRPQVRGIYGTDVFGFTLYTWREPDGENITSPNPFKNYTNIRYYFRRIPLGQPPEPLYISVKIWIVRAEGPDEEFEEILQLMGGAYITTPGCPIKTLVDTTLNAYGFYQTRWDGTDQFGQPAPDGFYRIYLHADGRLRWTDCLLVRDICELPLDFPIAGSANCD